MELNIFCDVSNQYVLAASELGPVHCTLVSSSLWPGVQHSAHEMHQSGRSCEEQALQRPKVQGTFHWGPAGRLPVFRASFRKIICW